MNRERPYLLDRAIFVEAALEFCQVEWSVLITEDDPSIRELIAVALRRQRIQHKTAADGHEALRKPNTVIVVTETDRALTRGLDPAVVNAVIFKLFNVVQLAAYVKASCELQHEDRRRSRIVESGH